MLANPTLDKLQTQRLHGMIKALGEQHTVPDINDLSVDERLGLMVDRELTEREDARLTTRLKAARLRHNACLEDIDYRPATGQRPVAVLRPEPDHRRPDGRRQNLARLRAGPQSLPRRL